MKGIDLKRNLLILNNAVLFLCTSIYLGTGWSLLLFSFPIEPQLTVDNYYLQFVSQVTLATQFFTYMTTLMIVLAIIMTIAEWKTGLRWFPIIVLVGIVVATGLTIVFILPLNDLMSKGITDPIQLKSILHEWIFLNQIRVALWTIQWLSMMVYFSYQENVASKAKIAGVEQ
ncbi:MAG TPA: hypothetical protein VL485_29070 [Ktedonobacteraceae bacterium]|jgi:hypothetical protein|nr:hypothetical protein [Ktedonobacteraceae bacterium]